MDWQDWLVAAAGVVIVGGLLMLCRMGLRAERECRAKSCPAGMHARMVENAGCACLTVPK